LIAMADARRIERVLSNLLENAIKYSPDGGMITISGYAQNMQIIISVRDEGIGIPADEQKKLFTPFGRVENEITRRTRGAGLGLAICRSIVELHEGRIWCDSEVGRGTTFAFSLPVALVQVPDA
jgi:two-component system, OmpR family, sensor histidine kinase VicK